MPRVKPRKISAKERKKDFKEVELGYTKEEAMKEARRCLGCGKCHEGCPVDVDIASFIGYIKTGDFDKALAVIKEKNNVPAICGRVCPQEDQCEKYCILGKKDEPIAIGRLERFVADSSKIKTKKSKPTGKRVAVVGSGPAGLTCAADLARVGHGVTIFESLHEPGGVLRYGIPEFRLPREVLDYEMEYIKKLGVKINCNVLIGQTKTLDEVRKEFDAVFIGTGAGLPYYLRIPGEELNGVYFANEFLLRVNMMKAHMFPEYDTPVKIGEKVSVIGAGNVAMDAARIALRLGAKKVCIVYRRSEDEMPARRDEIENAKAEGIEFKLLSAPVEIIGEGGWVKALKCIRMKLGEPDSSGRRRPMPIKGSEFHVDTDTVVVAIGQGPNPLLPNLTKDLNVDNRGRIKIDEDGMTSIEGVYAGGDIVIGAATVISAMGMGKKAAASIHRYLMD